MPRRAGERWCSDSRAKFTVGLDGEGSGRKPHRYTLLAWSNADGSRTEHIADGKGLATWRCLEFLLAIPPDARTFGFYLQYDWTMILKDLPNASLYALFRPQLRKLPKSEGGGFSDVRWRHYRLHFLAGMMRIKRGSKVITVWDVGRFYQCAFVKALDTWDIGTQAERELVKKMKLRRSKFRAKDAPKILKYCLLECKLLADGVDKLNAAHTKAGLKLRSWHGPGSTASLMLKAMRIDKIRGEQPPEVTDAALRAFFGGRFENDETGLIQGPIEGWDIISAYPAELALLPCLEHGRWEYTKRERDLDKCRHACVRYTLGPYPASSLPKRWGPLPCRMKDGTIVFPESGSTGWTWLKEYKAARAAWPQVRFEGAWLLRSDCNCQPFKRIEEWFHERLRVGKNTGVGLTFKLGYNSGYGKLVQQVGDPPFRCMIWGGMVTSGCRARILNALTDDVIAIATDGIYSKKPLPLTPKEELGGWERKEYDSIVLVRPGIYWTDPDEQEYKAVRARGLPRKSVSEGKQVVLDAIEKRLEYANLPDIEQFGGAMACVYVTQYGRFMRADRYGQWYRRPARIGLDPKPKRRPDYGLWTLPNVESAPYRSKVLSPDAKALKNSAELAWGNRG